MGAVATGAGGGGSKVLPGLAPELMRKINRTAVLGGLEYSEMLRCVFL